ncbi:hypothetical protein FQA39_LY02290 [Lamprigera yunnana]|nr:hypothetical protein FQA39_LY02290 [Lamprigera yunnana]
MLPAKEDVFNYEVNDAITRAGFGKFNLFILIATGGSLMSVIMESMGMMFVIPSAECDLQLSLQRKGLLSSASFAGMMIASNFWGILSDVYGRRLIILISMFSTFGIGMISSFAFNDWSLILLRFLSGLLLGGASTVIFTYNGELHDNYHRAKMIAWMATFIAIGNMLLPSLAWLILPGKWSFTIPLLNTVHPWRLLIIAYSLPTLFFGFCIYALPETPKFLLSKGKEEAAVLVLNKCFAFNTGESSNKYCVKKLRHEEELEENTKKEINFMYFMWTQTSQLFIKRFLKGTVMMLFLQFGLFATSSSLFMWYPELIGRISTFEVEHPNQTFSMCEAIQNYAERSVSISNNTMVNCTDGVKPDVFKINLLVGVFFIGLYVILGKVINGLGKKNCLIVLCCISASTGFLTHWIPEALSIKIFMGLSLTSFTAIAVLNTIVVDLYPTKIRGVAGSLCFTFARIGAVLGSQLWGYSFYYMCNLSFVVYGIAHIVFIVVTIFLPSGNHKNVSC